MAQVREKYGRGVVGLPFWVRVVGTLLLVVPSLFWFATSVVTGPPWTALTLAIAVLLGWPAYVFVPRLWERTEESVRADWHAHRLQKHLELEMGLRGTTPRVDHDPERPLPKRW